MSENNDRFQLEHLPDVVLRIIFSYLPFEEGLKLSSMSHAFKHLQPTIQLVSFPDFDENGPHSGNFCPEGYFDVSIDSIGLDSITASWSWKDQGWGNRKGQIWLRLVRGAEEIADSRYWREIEFAT